MSVPSATLVTQLDYTVWASRLIIEALKPLSEEELNRPLGTSHHGVIETLRHIYFADRVWLSRLKGAGRSLRDDGEAPSLMDLEAAWFPMLDELKSLVAGFGDAGVAEAFTFRNLAGEEVTLPRWQALLHVVNHATLHRGQIVTMLRQLGHAAPGTDLIFYYRRKK